VLRRTQRACTFPEVIAQPSTAPLKRRVAGVAVVIAIVLLQLASWYVANRDLGRALSVALFLAIEMPPVMLALSALFAWARRTERSVVFAVLLGLAISGLLGVCFGALFTGVAELWPNANLRLSTTQPLSLLRACIFGFTYALGHFGLWALAFALPVALEAAKIRSLEAEQLRVVADLARLRGHLEPHFLLNTLNAIAGLVTEDPAEARRLIAALGDLLRDALKDEDEMQTLEAQLNWLKRYAEIHEARHRGALLFKWEIDPASTGVMVPRLLLQPLVENAITHGALRRKGGGEVVIRTASGDGSTVLCTIEDNGPGMPSSVRAGAFGLESVRRRLALRFPHASRFTIESDERGTRSMVQVPR
jgi:sensor histidine kinase YesM